MRRNLVLMSLASILSSSCQANTLDSMMIKPMDLSENEEMLMTALTDAAFWVEFGEMDETVKSISSGIHYYIDGELIEEEAQMTVNVEEDIESVPINALFSIELLGEEGPRELEGFFQLNQTNGNSSYQFTRDFADSEMNASLWGTSLPEEGMEVELNQKIFIGYYLAGEDHLSLPSEITEPIEHKKGHLLAFYIEYHDEEIE